jgi:hypothetical protein
MTRAYRSTPLLVGSLLAAAASLPAAQAASQCEARTGAVPPAVVELYTSEGCSSCPPADRWLSSLKGRPGVVALAFHVNYWDYLGWPDRFATAATTERQHRLQRPSGARYVYTPQLTLNGRDWPHWPGELPPLSAATAPSLQLQRKELQFTATVAAAPTASQRQLAGYWAVLEDGHRSAVRAGENAGATLAHDHVVRLYQPVAPWPANETRHWSLTLLEPAPTGAGAPARRVVFVVTDGAGERPLQALELAC